jgi:hypothetical protein
MTAGPFETTATWIERDWNGASGCRRDHVVPWDREERPPYRGVRFFAERGGGRVEVMGWDVDGVTGESRYKKLLYSEAAGVLLAQFERDVAESRSAVRSLYIRERDATEYRRVFGGDDYRSAQHVVLSPRSTIAFFLELVGRKENPGGYDVDRIARVDLQTGEVTTALDMQTFRQKNDDGWVSDLIEADDDGKTLLCRTASWRTPKPAEGLRVGGVGYWLSRVNIETAEVDRITLLRHIGF